MSKHPKTNDTPTDLNVLVKITEDHDSGQCWGSHGEKGCGNPVKYKMVIEEWPLGDGYFNTAYWCETHKPR